MAANQGHHVGSLPNDYAILARFAHERNEHHHDSHSEVVAEDDSSDISGANADSGSEDATLIQRPHASSRSPRRSSFPSTYIRPQTSTIPSMKFKPDGQDPDEDTPLLREYVPRIEEEQFGNEDAEKSFTTMFWEELRVLGKYTVPVFG